MKTYSIKMKSATSQEHLLRRREFLTFSEAASWAYIARNKMGEEWLIVSITEDNQC